MVATFIAEVLSHGHNHNLADRHVHWLESATTGLGARNAGQDYGPAEFHNQKVTVIGRLLRLQVRKVLQQVSPVRIIEDERNHSIV